MKLSMTIEHRKVLSSKIVQMMNCIDIQIQNTNTRAEVYNERMNTTMWYLLHILESGVSRSYRKLNTNKCDTVKHENNSWLCRCISTSTFYVRMYWVSDSCLCDMSKNVIDEFSMCRTCNIIVASCNIVDSNYRVLYVEEGRRISSICNGVRSK